MPSAENRERVDMLEHVWRSMAELGASLDEAEWKAPSECPGWTVQDNLVHITALEKFILGDPLPSEDLPDDLPHVKNDVGRSNERWIESRRAWTGADALAEFVAVTDARLAQLRDLDDAGFAADSWTPMGPGTVRQLVGFRLFDSWVHEQDMRGAVDRPGDLDSAAARFSTEMMLEVLPYVIGKKVGAPDGSTVVLELTGPIVAATAVATTDGRARRSTPSPRSRPSRSPRLRRLRPPRLWAPRPRRGPGDRCGGDRRRRRTGRRRSCASSTTCSDPRDRRRASPDGPGHQRRQRQQRGAPAAAPARIRRRRARPRWPPRPPRPRGPLRRGDATRSGRRAARASRGSTSPPTTPKRSQRPSPPRSTAVDDLLDAACAEHGFDRNEAVVGGFSQGAGLALALGLGPSERARPAGVLA